MLTRLKGIKTVRKRLADGSVKVFRYHRGTGKRIEGEPGTTEFLENYQRASRREVDADTLAGLIARYKRSTAFADLAPRTMQDYDKHLTSIITAWGKMPIRALNDRRIRGDIIERRDELASRSRRQADYWVTVLSVVVGHGVDAGLLEHNHVKGISKLYASERSESIWLPEDVARMLGVSSKELELALMLGLHTGQREGDLLRLTWNRFDGRAITLRQSKTGTQVYIPCTVSLRTSLEGAPRRAATILTTSRGTAWTGDGFRSSWRKAARRAGIVHLHFNDLRGTAVTMLAEAGATVPEIATITGHSLRSVNQILERYLARTKTLAESAILKLERRTGSEQL